MSHFGAPSLAALVSPIGPRAHMAPTTCILKLARGEARSIRRSELLFFDAGGRPVGRLGDAFSMAVDTKLEGPTCKRLHDDRPRPERAVTMRWALDDDVSAPVPVALPEDEWGRLRVTYFPLQVPVEDDVHLLVQHVNTGRERVHLVDAIRRAALLVDGVPFACAAGWHWNGRSFVDPGATFTRWFRLSDFPGAPAEGEHALALEMLGMRTEPQQVTWSGSGTDVPPHRVG